MLSTHPSKVILTMRSKEEVFSKRLTTKIKRKLNSKSKRLIIGKRKKRSNKCCRNLWINLTTLQVKLEVKSSRRGDRKVLCLKDSMLLQESLLFCRIENLYKIITWITIRTQNPGDLKATTSSQLKTPMTLGCSPWKKLWKPLPRSKIMTTTVSINFWASFCPTIS